MSVMFLKQIRLHLHQLETQLGRSGGKDVDQELAQTRQFLSATKDEKFKRVLIKRIKQLEEGKKSATNKADLVHRHKMVKDLYDAVKDHPDYNNTRKRRAK